MRLIFVCLVAVASTVILLGCGGGDSSKSSADDASGLTPEQLEHGIGPISAFELAELDTALVSRGLEVFTVKCSACHKINERYIGPALGDVLERRSPAFVMNMILNPEQMLIRHPEAKALLAEYMTPMANQNLTESEARAILEYLRVAAAQETAS
jgi:mono/diheme cytochrome c family protein